ncbi:MAG: SulP family inorganic anion transporter [Phycisphaeraceae bacterium]|nr:SulP family inorganic anion transporter [Phycisphaeraceae bacterium]
MALDLMQFAQPFMPPIRTVRRYKIADLPADLVAGLTVSVVDLPQSMAFALIAGVPPVYGIYCAIFLAFLGALFTSSRFLSNGPTNTQSLLIAAVVSRVYGVHDMHYVYLVVALALLKGLIQLVFAAARMGGLVRYVSNSVMIGFTAGAGVLIFLEQMPGFLGIPVVRATNEWPGVIGMVTRLGPHLSEINPRAVGIGVLALVLVIGARRLSHKLPGALLAVVIASAMVWAMGWTENDLRIVGELPRGLPSFQFPHIGFGGGEQRISWNEVEAMLGGALALALLGMLESVAIAKSIAVRTGQRISANQEFFGQGFANVAGSFFMCMPGSGSFSRTALQYAVGARTRMASVACAVFNAAIFLALAGPARYIPLASLAAILFIVAFMLVDWHSIARIARTSRSDTAVCLITFASALTMPLTYAIYVGIFLNIALYLNRASQLHIAEMVVTHGGPFIERPIQTASGSRNVMFLQVEGDLFFGVADELGDRLRDAATPGVRVIILRLKRTHSIDITVLHTIEQFHRDMRARGVELVLCGLRPELLRKIRAYGLDEQIGPDNIFEAGSGIFASARRAIARASVLVGEAIDADDIGLDDDESFAYEI